MCLNHFSLWLTNNQKKSYSYKRKNVEELERLTRYGIEYMGLYYAAIEHAEPVYVREIAEFQSKFLDQIMSNEAALLLMEKGLE